MSDNKTPYQRHGYKDREHYLDCLAEVHGNIIYALAVTFGPSEDFDGLVRAIEDLEL